jgi:hypothetical protein
MDLGLNGVWFGPVGGSLVEFLIYFTSLVCFIDWDKITYDITERMRLDPNKTITVNYSLDEPLLLN